MKLDSTTRRAMLKLTASAVFAGLFSAPVYAEGKTIASVIFQQDQFFSTIQKGMQRAAKKAGVTLLEGHSDSKPENEIELIDTYIARGVDAIVMSPVSSVASVPALKRAHDKGIHIITYNSTITDETIPDSYLNSKQRDLGNATGVLAAEFIRDRLWGKAKIATLGFNALLPDISADRVDGFLEEVRKGNDIDVVSQQDAWLSEKAVQVAGDIIAANPDVNVIYAANEGGTVGAVQAVRNAGKVGEIYVFGVDGTEQLVNFILHDDDVLQAVTAQQPFLMGELAIEAAIAVSNGESVEKTVIVPVLGISRTDSDGAEGFLSYLKTFN